MSLSDEDKRGLHDTILTSRAEQTSIMSTTGLSAVISVHWKGFMCLLRFQSANLCMDCPRFIDLSLWVIMRAMWFCGGFHWIKVIGERGAPSEVPILTAAPHSSYFDAIPVTRTMCSIVAKLEAGSIPIWGSEFNILPSTDLLKWNEQSSLCAWKTCSTFHSMQTAGTQHKLLCRKTGKERRNSESL